MFCPNCNINYKDPDMRYCLNCGKPLEGSVASSPLPDTAPRRKPRTTPPETVVVQVGGRPRRIRRTYLLVFLLLLLLLLVCSCLMYTNVLASPVFLTGIFQDYTRLGFGCLNGLLLLFIFYIIIIILRLDFNCIYVPVGLLIVMVLCVILNIIGVVTLPDWVDDIVDVVIDPLPWDPGPVKPLPDLPKPPDDKKPSDDCCDIVEVTNVRYESVPGVTRFLEFDIECDGSWPVWGSQCITGKAFVGDTQDIFWTDVTCCDDLSMQDVMHCSSDSSVEQKVSWTKVELEFEDCYWEAIFYTPPYYKGGESPDTGGSECPSGQSLCGGDCCDPSDCYEGECSP